MASAVVIGFLTHLVLDEIWSVRLGMFGPKFKKSFGTALKFLGPDIWPNLATYGMAGALGMASAGDAAWSEHWAAARDRIKDVAVQQLSQLPQTAFFPQGMMPQQPASQPQRTYQQPPYQPAYQQPAYQQQYQQPSQQQIYQPQQQSWLRR
jgi:hypothetical protein